MPRPSHPPLFDHANIIPWTVKIIKLLIMRFLSFLWYFLSLQHPILKHPHTHTKQQVQLKIWIFSSLSFLRHETGKGRFWTEWYQEFSEFNLLLISSWMQFRFVIVVSKYFNFARVSKDLVVIFAYHMLYILVARCEKKTLVLSTFICRPNSIASDFSCLFYGMYSLTQ